MKVEQPPQDDGAFDMTPMIDIVFLLIAFFMTVASMVSDESVEIDLPFSDQSIVPELAKNRQYLTVTSSGDVYLGAKKMQSPSDIIPTLLDKNSRIKGFEVFLRGDMATEHRHIRQVMDAIAQAGVFKVIFANRKG
jgi:biopolymer transport protein ExbD